MAALQGRTFILKRGDAASPEVFTAVLGATSTGMAESNSELDITTNDESGVKTLLAGVYGKAGAITLSGISKDDAALASVWTDFNAGTIGNYQIIEPGATSGGTKSFAGFITSFEETGETDGALTYSISLSTSGVITKV